MNHNFHVLIKFFKNIKDLIISNPIILFFFSCNLSDALYKTAQTSTESSPRVLHNSHQSLLSQSPELNPLSWILCHYFSVHVHVGFYVYIYYIKYIHIYYIYVYICKQVDIYLKYLYVSNSKNMIYNAKYYIIKCVRYSNTSNIYIICMNNIIYI